MNWREVALCIRPPQLANFKVCNSLTFENALLEFTESDKRKAPLRWKCASKIRQTKKMKLSPITSRSKKGDVDSRPQGESKLILLRHKCQFLSRRSIAPLLHIEVAAVYMLCSTKVRSGSLNLVSPVKETGNQRLEQSKIKSKNFKAIKSSLVRIKSAIKSSILDRIVIKSNRRSNQILFTKNRPCSSNSLNLRMKDTN